MYQLHSKMVPSEARQPYSLNFDHRVRSSLGIISNVKGRSLQRANSTSTPVNESDPPSSNQPTVAHAAAANSISHVVAGVAHDMNNVLTVILGVAELALLDLDSTNPIYEQFEQIRRAAYHGSDLNKQLLASRAPAADQPVPTNLNTVAAEQVDLLDASLPSSTTLAMQFDQQLPLIQGDATQLRRVVLNLLRNASDAIGSAPGCIIVRTARIDASSADIAALDYGADLPAGTYVALTVADTGHGMDAATRARIFEASFTTKSNGHGLGLMVVLETVRMHNGGIKLQSAPGQGSSFTLLFPIV